MKKILFDTNVVLDVLLDRQPYGEASASVWASVETGISVGMLAAHSVTTIHYLVRKEKGNESLEWRPSMAPLFKRRCNCRFLILRRRSPQPPSDGLVVSAS